MAKPIYMLNGPNLNLLGTREPEIYGSQSLQDIAKLSEDHAASLGHSVVFRQSNSEGELVGWIHEAREKGAGIIVNAGAYTHTSIAIRDALIAAQLPAGMDEDRVGAMSAAMLSLGERTATELARGDLEQVLIKGDSGYVLMTHAGKDAVVSILAKPSARLGLVFLDIKRAAENITKLL